MRIMVVGQDDGAEKTPAAFNRNERFALAEVLEWLVGCPGHVQSTKASNSLRFALSIQLNNFTEPPIGPDRVEIRMDPCRLANFCFNGLHPTAGSAYILAQQIQLMDAREIAQHGSVRKNEHGQVILLATKLRTEHFLDLFARRVVPDGDEWTDAVV
jgi:hypothetical protein